LGLELPITPVRHSIAVVQRTPDFGQPHPVVADRLTGSYYRPEGSSLTLVGASPPYEGQIDPDVESDRKPTPDDLAVLSSRFCHRFPSQADAGLRPGYTGVYDCTPDTQPVLGPAPGVDGLHLAAGFSGHGFKLSPAVGDLVSQQIIEGHTSLVDIDLFRLSRFAENKPITVAHPYSMATLG
jgi:sarcosine oxidase subunit beta